MPHQALSVHVRPDVTSKDPGDGATAEFGKCLWHATARAATAGASSADAGADGTETELWRGHEVQLAALTLDLDRSVLSVARAAPSLADAVKAAAMTAPAVAAPFSHAGQCPTAALQRRPDGGASVTLDPAQSVRVGVACVVERADGRILITQRAAHMRAFPGVWVVPGGHWEAGESLQAAGAREVLEETGVAVDAASMRLLALWESVFPIDLAMGAPRRQHLVAFYHVKVQSKVAAAAEAGSDSAGPGGGDAGGSAGAGAGADAGAGPGATDDDATFAATTAAAAAAATAAAVAVPLKLQAAEVALAAWLSRDDVLSIVGDSSTVAEVSAWRPSAAATKAAMRAQAAASSARDAAAAAASAAAAGTAAASTGATKPETADAAGSHEAWHATSSDLTAESIGVDDVASNLAAGTRFAMQVWAHGLGGASSS